MIYIGWNDYHNPLQTIDYYNEVLKISGEKAKNSIRLFNVPGMGHCSGGDGCDTFDKLGTMEAWLETGIAPDEMLSSKVVDGKVVRTRPLCAYPKVAKYKGTGNTDEAVNFVCEEQ
jgi:feruloyl esterase